MADTKISVSDYIVRRLLELNCRHIYGVPAASASNLVTRIDHTEGVSFINTSSELEAGYAADGYARVNGFGATAVSYGVGTQCFVNAISAALVEKVPMMVINGGPTKGQLDIEARYGVLFTHSTGRSQSDLKIFTEITLAARRLDNVATIGADIDALFVKALSDLGPVYLEIANDIFLQQINPPTRPLHDLIPAPDSKGLDAFVKKTREKLAKAKNPLFLVGAEVVRDRELPPLLVNLLNARKLRYYTTVMGKSALPEDNQYFHGTFDSDLAPDDIVKALYTSDCVICLGCVFGVTYTNLVTTRDQYMIRVGFDQGRIDGATYAGVPLKGFIEALTSTDAANAAGLPGYGTSYIDRRYHWVREGATESPSLTHNEIFQALDTFLTANLSTPYTMMVDTCLGAYPGADLPMKGEHNYLADPVWLSIGWAAGACIGVCQGSGRRPIVVVGDGGFQTIAQCVSTIARYRLPVIMIIIDNAVYGTEQYVLDSCYFLHESKPPYSFVDLNQWDYTAMKDLFGITTGGAFQVDTVADLQSMIEQAHDDPEGTYIIVARVDPRDLPPENYADAKSKCAVSIDASDAYMLEEQSVVAIPDDDVVRTGLIVISLDGDAVPGSAIVQVNRTGDGNNGAAVISCCIDGKGYDRWRGGGTSDPGSGEARVWVDGTEAGARLMIRNTKKWSRNCRISSLICD